MSRALMVAGTVAAALLSPLLVLEARAQDRPAPLLASVIASTTFDAALGTTSSALPGTATDAAAIPERPALRQLSVEPHRSTLLTSLYATTAMWQVLDVHSTLRVLDSGGAEGNPVLSGFAQNRTAFVAAKAAIAASSIYAASRIGRRNKMAAAAALIGINAAYALVVSHNYALARSMR